MQYCSRCGKKLDDDSHFCPSCGTRTSVGVAAGINYPPLEDFKEAFSRAGDEMERAFNMAAQEIRETFKNTSRVVRESVAGETMTCPECGWKNPSRSVYCSKCGKKIG
jgi:predicted RNA-binding Zn-ribbon protein involved in translation (DUF1610 family)